MLSETGAPTPVAWTRLRPPRSLVGQTDAAAQQQAVAASPLTATYGQAVDRESAYEKLAAKLAPAPAPAANQTAPAREHRDHAEQATRRSHRRLLASPVFKSFARSAASSLGREVTRGLFGTGSRRR